MPNPEKTLVSGQVLHSGELDLGKEAALQRVCSAMLAAVDLGDTRIKVHPFMPFNLHALLICGLIYLNAMIVRNHLQEFC